MGNTANRDRERIALGERAKQALEMRLRGYSYEAIAEKLGWADASGVWRVVQAAIKAQVKEPAEEVRKMEIGRLDGWLLSLSERCFNGDAIAIQTCLRIMDRRTAYLGLDAPKKSEVTANVNDLATFLAGAFEAHQAKERQGEGDIEAPPDTDDEVGSGRTEG